MDHDVAESPLIESISTAPCLRQPETRRYALQQRPVMLVPEETILETDEWEPRTCYVSLE